MSNRCSGDATGDLFFVSVGGASPLPAVSMKKKHVSLFMALIRAAAFVTQVSIDLTHGVPFGSFLFSHDSNYVSSIRSMALWHFLFVSCCCFRIVACSQGISD